MSKYDDYSESELREALIVRDATVAKLRKDYIYYEQQRVRPADGDSNEEEYRQLTPAGDLIRGLQNRAENLQGIIQYGFERTSTAMTKLKRERDDFERENIQLRNQLAAANGNGNRDGFATNIKQDLQSGSTQYTTINNGPVYMTSPFNVEAPLLNASARSFGPLPYRTAARVEDIGSDTPADDMDVDVKKHTNIKPPRYSTDCAYAKKGICRGGCKFVHDNQRGPYSKLIPTLPRNKWDKKKDSNNKTEYQAGGTWSTTSMINADAKSYSGGLKNPTNIAYTEVDLNDRQDAVESITFSLHPEVRNRLFIGRPTWDEELDIRET
ncbi:hypothetical protein BDU57DRAFT_596520 [Ampelomyces quisqualis]|uniref:Uncharacterized protein n=1 Tax=Ampelomyces quisqualis TaxID=50730 RepID=A0A6A5QIQ3_AMPQU|nr:hypothetical protein BDU57DRAFT_596520 [Ampelomyces quisqualis]